MPDNVASVNEVTKIYAKPGTTIAVEALRGVTIDFKRGELVAIRGASGSGKSTLMNILGCLDRPTAGSYRLDDQDVSLLDDAELSHLRSRRLGFVFQNFNLIQQLTVIENLEVPLFYQSCPAKERRERAMHHIEMVGLADRSHHRPMELSGGQQQRVAIARAMVNDPAIILADEPTGNLDSATGEMILDIFARLHDEGRTIILVTHESHVSDRCERIITLKDGLIQTDERKSGGNGQT